MERAWSEEGVAWAEATFGRENFSRWTTDSLETSDDLEILYSLLDSYRTKFSSVPVITANFITHNVGRDSNGSLLYKPLSSGFFSDVRDVRPLYMEGIRSGIIFPQFHGFCHFIPGELEVYNTTDKADEAFNNRFFLVHNTLKGKLNWYHGEMTGKNERALENLEMGLKEFKNFFGYKSVSIIPPTYLLDKEILDRLSELGIHYLQAGNRIMRSNGRKYLYPPLRRGKNVLWGIRNARLDPHPEYQYYHEQCLASISNAFKKKLPAVIDFHRVNFAGRYARAYRERTIKELRALLDGIYRNWPQVNFISTPQLVSLLDGTPQSD